MFLRQHGFLLLFLLFVGALVTAHFVLVRKTTVEQARSYGRYTAQQVRERAEPVCRALAPEARLHLATEQRHNYGPDGSLQRHWIVDCMDEAGRDVAHLDWDADTGALCFAGHHPPMPPPTTVRVSLNRRASVRAAWDWLCMLGVADQALRWRLAQPPQWVKQCWQVSWQAEGHVALVTIDASSGHFTQVRSWRQKQD